MGVDTTRNYSLATDDEDYNSLDDVLHDYGYEDEEDYYEEEDYYGFLETEDDGPWYDPQDGNYL